MSKDKDNNGIRNANMMGAGQKFNWEKNEKGEIINRAKTVREQSHTKKPEQTWGEHVKPKSPEK
ncbi:hypothetical protein [Runella limosa]|uniref:hypothetical protein n=1 Tax=Runella limosa TaxID=370978 RepID=UPI00041C2B1D|nr:hypothetical protein [Runella limosa]